MLTRIAAPLVALACFGLPHAAVAQGRPLPTGGDSVVIGRLHQRTAQGTQAVARFGLMLDKKGGDSTVVDVPEARAAGLGAYQLTFSASRKGSGAHLSWTVTPGAGGTLRQARGEAKVEPGAPQRVLLASEGGSEVFAFVETGRASQLSMDTLMRSFGGAAEALPAGGGAPSAYAAPPLAAAGIPVPPRPAPVTEERALQLAFRLEQDGVVRFAPRVLVGAGEAFAVSGGPAASVAGAGASAFEGFEIAGTARLAGGTCFLDLSVQSGRSVGAGPAVHVVDRYRRDVRVEAGRETLIPLFEDLRGSDAGRLSLAVSCEPR